MSKIGNSILVILLSCLFSVGTRAADPMEDAYREIRPVQPTHSGDRIEVLEVFWYGCPHCFVLEPYLEKWQADKPDDVEFRRMPGILNSGWVSHARAYYTAEKLGIVDNIHRPLFNAIHNERKPIIQEQDLREFFVSSGGIDGNEFTRIFNSKEIDIKMRQALVSQQKYRIDGVPAIIVNGRYLTNGTLARSYENIINVINFLVEKERKEKQER